MARRYNRIMVVKVTDKKRQKTLNSMYHLRPPLGNWFGACECGQSTWTYFSFGAVLGHGLEHQRRCRKPPSFV